jgi:Malectin domain
VGAFAEANSNTFTIGSLSQFQNTLDSELFQHARMSASSLRYYGIGLENGNYTVTLQFAEIAYPNTPPFKWESLGRRIFDIYIQVLAFYFCLKIWSIFNIMCSVLVSVANSEKEKFTQDGNQIQVGTIFLHHFIICLI